MRICAIGLRGIPDVVGGIEQHCQNLYPRLADLDDTLEVTVIGRSSYARSGMFNKIRLISLWAPRKKALETLVHSPLAILYARLRLHPHVVHLHGVGPGFFAPLARLLGFRVLATHHAADYDRPKWSRFGKAFLRAGEWMIGRFANEVVCVSSDLQGRLEQRFPKDKARFVTIHNGAPTGVQAAPGVLAELGLEPNQYVLGVGRLDVTKGFHDLVEAFERARPGRMKLVIAGAAPIEDEYARALRKSGSERVIFAGAQSSTRLQALYENAALFVHPSYLEGFALVVLEALAADTPMLISDIPAHREVGLEPNCYFPVGNVSALAGRLGTEEFAAMRSARRADILADNDWDEAARRHRDIVLHLAAPRRPAPETGMSATG